MQSRPQTTSRAATGGTSPEAPAARRALLSLLAGPFADDSAVRKFVASVRSRSEIGSLQKPQLRRSNEGIKVLLRFAAFNRAEALAELESLARQAAVDLKVVRGKRGPSGNRRSRELLSLAVGHFADESSAKTFARQIRSRTGRKLAGRPRLSRTKEGLLLSFKLASSSPRDVREKIDALAQETGVEVREATLASPPRRESAKAAHQLSITLGPFPNLEQAREFTRSIPTATGLVLSDRPQIIRTDGGLNLELRIGSPNPAADRQKIRALAADFGVVVRSDFSAPRTEIDRTSVKKPVHQVTMGPFDTQETARQFMRELRSRSGIAPERLPKVVSAPEGVVVVAPFATQDVSELRADLSSVADDIIALQQLMPADSGATLTEDVPAITERADDTDDEARRSAGDVLNAPVPPLPIGDAEDARSQIGAEIWTDPLEVEGGLRAYVIGIPTRKVALTFTKSLGTLGSILEITRSDVDRTDDGLRLALGFSTDDRVAGWSTLMSLANMLDLKVIDANLEPVELPEVEAEPELPGRVPIKTKRPEEVSKPPEAQSAEDGAARAAIEKARRRQEVALPRPAGDPSERPVAARATYKREVAAPVTPPADERSPRRPDERLPELDAPALTGEPAKSEIIAPSIGWIREEGDVLTQTEIQREHIAIEILSQVEEAVEAAPVPEVAGEPRSILRPAAFKTLRWGLTGAFAVSMTAAVLLFVGTIVPTLLGYKTMIVTSGSMEPTIHVGDAVLIQEGNAPGSIEVDDIITFNDGAASGMNTHRVRLVKEIQGREHFQTKGDANVTTDPNLVPIEAVYGKAVFTLPKFGRLLNFAAKPQGKMFLIVLPLVFLMAKELGGLMQGAKRSGPDEDLEEQKPDIESLDLRDAVANA